MRIGRTLTAAAACASVALGITTSAANAAPGSTVELGSAKQLSYVKAKYTDVMAQVFQTAECPSGSINGGGAAISGPGAGVAVNEMYPVAGEDAWQAEGSAGAAGARNLTTFAICGSDSSIRTAGDSDIDPGGNTALLIGCNTDDEEITASGVSTNALGIRLNSMIPAPFAAPPFWSTVAENPGSATVDATWHTLCTEAYDLRYRRATTRVPAGEDVSITAPCQPDEAVIGGGWQFSKDLVGVSDVWGLASRPKDAGDADKVPENGWFVRGHNDRGEQVKLVATAICKR